MPAVPASPKRSVRVRLRMPLRLIFSDVLSLPDGRLAEIRFVCVSQSAWEGRREASQPGWAVRHWGPLVVAYRIAV